MLTGVYLATKKDKTVYYRSNITYKDGTHHKQKHHYKQKTYRTIP